ncbi:MAG: response regulator transcription factor [Planctomycetes bacterium]|nr:response regulator transcription factor [Planctomycetota bacterium]
MKRALQEHGYFVEFAESAVEADLKVQGIDWNLVVLDLELPGRSGLRFVEEWRTIGIAAPVLALTSQQAGREKAKALDLGADVLVTKPYDREELTAQIRALLRRARPADSGVVRVHDLEIDASARSVTRAGRSIKLTRREFAILQYLAAYQGKVVSRSMIRTYLFGHGRRSRSNVVDVHIRGLRNKIDKDFDVPLIETCYGEGYKLRADAGDAAANGRAEVND